MAKLKALKEVAKPLEENKESIMNICNETEDAQIIEIFEGILSKYNINSTYGLYEYDLDFKLNYNNEEIFCDFNFESEIELRNHKKTKRILKEKMEDWINLDKKVCYILMDVKSEKLYYYNINDNLKTSNKYMTIQIEEKNNIEENIEEYKEVFFE